MYYQVDRKFNLLKVNDPFATLVQMHDDGSLEFEFVYSVLQSDVIKFKATRVEVSVYTRTVAKPSIMGTSKVGRIDTRQMMDNILGDMTVAKSTLKNQENYVLTSRNSDVSAFINNEIVKDLATRAPRDIQSMYTNQLKSVPAGELKQANDDKPILHSLDLGVENVHTHVSSSIEEDSRELIHDLILRRGIDPSEISAMTPKVIHSQDAFKGTLRSTVRSEASFGTLNRLHDHLTLHADLVSPKKLAVRVGDQQMVDVVVNEPRDDIEVPIRVRFTMPKKNMSSRESSDVFVKFQLRDATTGHSIDEIERSLNVTQHVRVYLTPIEPPIVKAVTSEISTRVNLEIGQRDATADTILVYKKVLFTSQTDIDDYSLVGTYSVKGQQRALVQVDKPVYDAAIYRVVPANKGVIGSVYTNVVVTPRRYRPIHAIAMTTKAIDNGIMLEARKIPPTVIAVQFLMRNLTTHESKFAVIDDPQLVDDAARKSDHLSVVTSNVIDGNVYEFAARAYTRDGCSEIMDNDVIEYVLPSPGKVNITVSDVNVNHDDAEPEVTFNVNLSVLDGELDSIKSLLEQQGIKSYFEGDIARQREQLQNLLAYSVHRIDLSTGHREDIGVMTDSSFSDKAARKRLATVPLKYGHKYRYIISAVSRAPETLFSALTKQVTDPLTRKQYQFNPAKFMHPVSLKRGTLVTAAGLKTRYTKSVLEHGALGSHTTVDVSLDEEPIKVMEARADKFDSLHNVITWRVQGSMNAVDHFVVMKEVHQMRTVIGCAHNQFNHGSCQWLHKLSSRDRGEIRYVVVPVLNDYRRGQLTHTNALAIG